MEPDDLNVGLVAAIAVVFGFVFGVALADQAVAALRDAGDAARLGGLW